MERQNTPYNHHSVKEVQNLKNNSTWFHTQYKVIVNKTMWYYVRIGGM